MDVAKFILHLAVGVIFFTAGVKKIAQPEVFKQIVLKYEILPDTFSVIISLWLPWIEAIIGGCILLGLWTKANSGISMFLLLVFIIFLLYLWTREIDIPCGCLPFDPGDSSILYAIFRDFLLFVFSLILFLSEECKFTPLAIFYRLRSKRSPAKRVAFCLGQRPNKKDAQHHHFP